jgi:hypothetical protein
MKPLQVIQRVLALLRSGWQRPPGDQRDPYAWLPVSRRPPGDLRDPYAWRPVSRRPQPKPRSGAVAVAEPDE